MSTHLLKADLLSFVLFWFQILFPCVQRGFEKVPLVFPGLLGQVV